MCIAAWYCVCLQGLSAGTTHERCVRVQLSRCRQDACACGVLRSSRGWQLPQPEGRVGRQIVRFPYGVHVTLMRQKSA